MGTNTYVPPPNQHVFEAAQTPQYSINIISVSCVNLSIVVRTEDKIRTIVCFCRNVVLISQELYSQLKIKESELFLKS